MQLREHSLKLCSTIMLFIVILCMQTFNLIPGLFILEFHAVQTGPLLARFASSFVTGMLKNFSTRQRQCFCIEFPTEESYAPSRD